MIYYCKNKIKLVFCLTLTLYFRFALDGFCRKMKQAIVKQKWSEAERYPLINRLTCVNETCLFYLVFNSDILTNGD